MMDEQEDAATAVADDAQTGDDATVDATATADGAIDMSAMAEPVETADEPAVSPEELLEIPDAPERPGEAELAEHIASAASADSGGDVEADADADPVAAG